MVTEKGTIVTKTKVDEEVQRVLNKKISIISLIAIILGAVGVLALLVLDIVLTFRDQESAVVIAFLMVFAVILGCGIGLLLIVKKQVNFLKTKNWENGYEFYKNYFIVNQFTNGENVAVVKNYVTQIEKAKETEKYLFFFISSSMAYPVSKEGLTDDEINTLRSVFSLPVKGNILPLPEVDVSVVEGSSPFSDLDKK
jgi:ABC-type transport system involved in multi-copper enzyme maturation permease subunit